MVVPLARDNLPGLASHLASNARNEFERKVSGKRAVRARKGFTLFLLNGNMNDIIKIIKSLEDMDVLIECITKTVKYEIEKQEGGFLPGFLAPLAASLVKSGNYSVVKGVSGRLVTRAGREHMDSFGYV